MIDLTTTYLGLKLDNPLVPSSSPLSKDYDQALRLQDAGAGAIVMHSLFEEETRQEEMELDQLLHYQATGCAEAESFFPETVGYVSGLDRHLEQLRKLKQNLEIPVIASLNGISMDGWVQHGKELQQAGADALELNVYYVAANIEESATSVEQRYLHLLTELRRHVTIPITMKLSSMFSSVGHMVSQLEQAGASGVSLFNRFYQPNIDPDTLSVTPQLELSGSMESLLRIRWVAILYGKVNLSLAVTGGIHTRQDVARALLAGADVTHMCSALLQHGPGHIHKIKQELLEWMEQREYASVEQLKGSVSQVHAPDPVAFERCSYVHILDRYSGLTGEAD